MSFADLARSMDAGIAATLCDPGVVYPAAGGLPVSVRLTLDEPIIEDQIDRARVARTQAVVEVLASDLAVLRDKDEIVTDGRRWRVQGTPTKRSDGAWWTATVSEVSMV